MSVFFDKIKNFIGFRDTFNDIIISTKIIQKITDLPKETHPKEFLAFFEGKIGKDIIINDIFYQPYLANDHSASPRLDIPLTTNTIGSIHSHPSFSNRPSRADRRFFRKNGIVHAIIKYPYNKEDIAFYNNHGEPIEVKII